MVKKILGEPDKMATSPHYAKAAPSRLYSLERVVRAEQTLEFMVAHLRAAERSQNAIARTDARVKSLHDLVAKTGFVVRVIPEQELLEGAINS